MHFVGLDLAWGERNQSGVAAVAADGRLLHVGAALDDDEIKAVIAPYVTPAPHTTAPKPTRDRDLRVRMANAEAKLAALTAELDDIRRHLDARDGAS